MRRSSGLWRDEMRDSKNRSIGKRRFWLNSRIVSFWLARSCDGEHRINRWRRCSMPQSERLTDSSRAESARFRSAKRLGPYARGVCWRLKPSRRPSHNGRCGIACCVWPVSRMAMLLTCGRRLRYPTAQRTRITDWTTCFAERIDIRREQEQANRHAVGVLRFRLARVRSSSRQRPSSRRQCSAC